jgi:CBS domain containing-hemolysin-like protein
LVHEKIDSDFYIAEPHIEIVEDIERIADEFEKPKTGLSISSKEVFYFYEEDKLKDILACIKKKSHTRFPIYNNKEEFRWLLTTKEIIIWLASQFDNPKINLDEVKIKDLYNTKHVNRVEFVSQNTTVFEIEDIFEEDHKNKNKLEAVLITPRGKRTEKPNGIITSSDLLEEELAE